MTTEHLQEQLARNSRSPLFARLADEYLRSQRTDEALKLCLDGLQYFPDYATAHIVVARCLAQKGDLPTALSHLDVALRMYQGNSTLTVLYNEWVNRIASNPALRDGAKGAHPPKLPPQSTDPANSTISEMTGESDAGGLDDVPIVSVTLAEIYATQGAYEAAIAMYRKLQQQKPQQAMQFEAKIQELKEKIR